MPMSFDGRAANLSGWFIRPKVQETGSIGSAERTPASLRIGHYAMATAEHWEPFESRGSRTVVCPVKAGMFSRRRTCRGNSQEPRSLDSRVAGNQDPEAYRQGLPRGDHESPGRNDSERECGLEIEKTRGPSPHPKGEGSMGCRNLTDTALQPRRGGSDSTVTRTC